MKEILEPLATDYKEGEDDSEEGEHEQGDDQCEVIIFLAVIFLIVI